MKPIRPYLAARAAAVLAAALSSLYAQCPSNADLSAPILKDYIYGYAPVTMQAVRALQTAVPDAKSPGRAPINQFVYRTTLITPDEHLIVRPNADTLYTSAWLDLSQQPIILHVPDTGGRYYLMPMLDAYSNEFASIGARTTGTAAGDWAIVGPAWHGPLPESVSGLVHAPTDTVLLNGRTLVRGQADLQAAAAIVTQFQLIPMSAFPDFLRTGVYIPPTGVPVKVPNSDFTGLPITNSPGFSKPEFFDVLAAYALQNPPPRDQFVQSSALVLDGFLRQTDLTANIVQEANQALTCEALSIGTIENGWTVNFKIGNYDEDYLLRAAVAKFGFGAITADDAVYLAAATDIGGNPLSGANNYVVHFAPGQTPPERGFWSITVYDQNGFLIFNPIQRYDVGSETGLTPNADGSIDIFVQNTPPVTMQNNWLPAPTGPFELTIRVYWPDASILNGTWTPPTIAVTKAMP